MGIFGKNYPTDSSSQARPSHPAVVSDLTDALLDKWATTPTYTLQNLAESLPRTVEAVMAAEGETNSTLIPLDLETCGCNVWVARYFCHYNVNIMY